MVYYISANKALSEVIVLKIILKGQSLLKYEDIITIIAIILPEISSDSKK